jgi:O-succinylbenzoic acid--CoA ligase
MIAPAAAAADDDRALSIRAAAAEAPGGLALVDDDGALDLAAAAALVDGVLAIAPPLAPDRAQPLIATPTRATLVTLWAALARRQPLGLLHARAPAAEHAALAARLAAAPVPADTLAVVFTSGSTGRPKGVVLSRAAARAAAALHAAHLGWRDDDRWLLALPLAHVGGLAIALRCLVARRPVVLSAGGVDGARLADELARHRVTLASLVPAQLDALLARPAWRPPAALRAILLGGAAAPAGLVDRARDRGVPALTTYGLSEAFGQVATAPAAVAPPRGAIGVPLAGVTITAGTADRPAPIAITTPTRMTGYLDEPDGPSLADPAAVAAPLVTADLGFLADGWLHVAGRADDIIITGGENVHPAAVEAALVAAPGVAAACVVGSPDARWGQLVTAVVVAAAGFDRGRALASAAARLPAHARPRRLVVVDALPLTASGKLDRRRVAAELAPRATPVAP